MLKLNYTEDGLYMEQIMAPLEMLVAQRVMLAMRSGQALHLESGRAAFLLAKREVGLRHLEAEVHATQVADIAITNVDADFIEVSLHGHWLAENIQANEGMFIVALPLRLEYIVHRLWKATQAQSISMRKP